MQTVPAGTPTPTPVEEQLEQNDRIIEAIEPSTAAVKRVFMWKAAEHDPGPARQVVYVQRELGLYPAEMFMSMMIRIMKDVMQGKYGINVGELLSGGGDEIRKRIPSEITASSINDMTDDAFLTKLADGFLALVAEVPDLQLEIMALSLGVERDKITRQWFKDCISGPPEAGGVTIDEGMDILMTFVAQNAKPIRRLLGKQTVEIWKMISETLELKKKTPSTESDVIETTVLDSHGSTPSSTSSQAIREND